MSTLNKLTLNYLTKAQLEATIASGQIQQDEIYMTPDMPTPAQIGACPAPLRFFDISVPASGWDADATYTDYAYRKSVALEGVIAAMIPDVILAPGDATGGDIAPVATSYNGGIYLYAKEIPQAAITIPTITLWGAV